MDRTEEDSILMKAFRSKLALLSLTFFLGIAGIAIGQGLIVAPADIIVTHGRVYTENPKQPWAQAVAIHGTKIVAVGDDTAIEKMRGMGTKIINASGKLVLPGFNDCHVHFLGGSMSLGHVDLAGAKDVADIQKRLRAYASERPGDGWVLGRGWDYAMFGSETLPHKKYLDKLFPDRPVLLEGYDGQTYWANSKDLALAGITRDTPNPPDGMIVRDRQTGEATGAVKAAASGLVSTIVVDSVVESHTGAMLEPYSDDPSLKGKPFWEPANYNAAVAELDKRGFQLFTHAIGDYGVRMALDGYENAEERNHKKDRRWRIEHIETVASADIPRFGKLDVIASMQPLHSYPDADTLDVWARNVGPDRASRAWAWKSIADGGGHLAFGSDWPVVTLDRKSVV